MRIALVSFEYPPETAVGGIGTYTFNVAAMLRDRGHEVEVFAGGGAAESIVTRDDIRVFRNGSRSRHVFPTAAGRAVAMRHHERPFDVMEGPEFGAEAALAARAVPHLPLLVKLHTPSFLARQLNRTAYSPYTRLRAAATNLWNLARRREILRSDSDVERRHAGEADQLTSPSLALADIVAREWRIPRERIAHLPNPFVPSAALLNIAPLSTLKVVTFVGRLEPRKGVLDLAEAIPQVLARVADVSFHLVGNASVASPERGLDMRAYLLRILGEHHRRVRFIEHVPPEAIPGWLAASSVCVFPSVWENFPYVCLEAMAAGRAIVASAAGGMTEMLDNGQAGVLVPARAPADLADAIVALLADEQRRQTYGERARARLLTAYSPARIGELQEQLYWRAIEHRRQAPSR